MRSFGLRRTVGRFLVGRHVAAGEDDSARAETADEFVGDIRGMDFAVDPGFPNAAGDQLRDLGSEIEDQDSIVGHVEAGDESLKVRGAKLEGVTFRIFTSRL